MHNINHSLKPLENYIFSEDFRGYDPYDALMSPLFRLPFFKSNKFVRLASQQILRRLPVNIRPLIGIKKSLNPVTLGLCIQALSYQFRTYPARPSREGGNPDATNSFCFGQETRSSEPVEQQFDKINFLLEKLIALSGKGFSGVCWGYDFDWDGKYIRAKAFYPTVVATGIVVNALFEVYQSLGTILQLNISRNCHSREGGNPDTNDISSSNSAFIYSDTIEKLKSMILSASDFVRKDLKKTYYGETFCYSYSPGDEQSVLNASMKGVRILAQAYSINNDYALIDEAEKAVKFVCNNQNENGSWVYSIGDTRTWSDSYHTGYILDCLQSFVNISGKKEYLPYIEKGFDFFKNNFIGDDGFPKYYSNNLYPVDCTSAGQIALTLCNFGKLEEARKVLEYMIKNMQDDKGYFYYQKGKYTINKISYMRWSNAWMYVALSRFLSDKVTKK